MDINYWASFWWGVVQRVLIHFVNKTVKKKKIEELASLFFRGERALPSCAPFVQSGMLLRCLPQNSGKLWVGGITQFPLWAGSPFSRPGSSKPSQPGSLGAPRWTEGAAGCSWFGNLQTNQFFIFLTMETGWSCKMQGAPCEEQGEASGLQPGWEMLCPASAVGRSVGK